MLNDLDSGPDIARHTEKLLRRADAGGRLPTPVEDIIVAAKLVEPKESLLSDSALRDVPEHLARKIRKLRFKAHAVLDRKTREIHISPDIAHDGQRRFKRCHEVTHAVLPWQQDTAYADDAVTLSWSARQLFEQEANQGGAELLFQRHLYQDMAADYPVGLEAIIELADKFGSSYHASFRRFIETHRGRVAGLVLERSPCSASPLAYRRKEGINSSTWTERYDRASEWPKLICAAPYAFVGGIPDLTDLPVRSALPYPNINSEPTTLQVELWSNSYRVFVLLWVSQRERFKRKRIIIPSAQAA
jgi:Zn-dependent peptidase ImmA (M78 family)